MNDLRAKGGLAYVRSIIGIVLARPIRNHLISKRLASKQIITSDSLVYNVSVFISQLDWCFVVPVEITSPAKVADTKRNLAMVNGSLD